MGELQYRTLRENVADAIRTKILNQELKPGMRIIEKDLAEEYSISRGPVREALRQLEEEGLIEYNRNVGCSVKDVTLEDIYEIYLLKANYEVIAVRMCKGIFSDAALSKMEDALEHMKCLNDGDLGKINEWDNKFHEAIIQMAQMVRLEKAWGSLDYGTLLCCYVSYTDRNTISNRQYPIHKELYDICCTKDEDQICRAILEHYELTFKRVIKEKGISEKDFKFHISSLY